MGIAVSHRRAEETRHRQGASAQRFVLATLAAALLALTCLTTGASADAGEQIIERCTHGQSLGGFSQQAYRRALAELPTEVEEYSDCANLIRQAQLSAAAGRSGSSGGGGAGPVATPLSPSEHRALQSVPRTGAKPLAVGGSLVRPGVVHADIASALSSLPDPLLAVLALMLACLLALGARAIGRSVRARRPD
jgi:hypothetical protein